MTLTRIAAPEADPVSLAEVREQVRINSVDEDAVIARMIAAAVGRCDGPDGMIGRALITQTWRLTLDAFPAEIEIPLPPLQSVSSIIYLDGGGAEQTLSASVYQVIGVGGRDPARIHPAYGESWPATRAQPEAVAVTFVAGYGAGAADVPAAIRHEIEKAAADLYEFRELPDMHASIMAKLHDALLPYRVWTF